MKKRRRPQNAFSQASRNLSVRCVITSFKPRAGTRFPVGPVPGYRTRRKAHALPIVRDEFRPAIPRRVARQHCPSPLHRHHQLKTIAASKEMIYHRTVNSLLTVCLTHRDNSNPCLEQGGDREVVHGRTNDDCVRGMYFFDQGVRRGEVLPVLGAKL